MDQIHISRGHGLCGRIGDPVDTPQFVSVEIATEMMIGDIADSIRRMVAEELDTVDQLTNDLIYSSVSLW